ncbi:MAG: YkgJ family cysteine cluster protein [Deltaproteobacteria bacterium]|jgi:Fe-S-cluster containining protein|nr:YkgJ family cysteine cluster protein [Deltaproteobacteria bacterium]MBW2487045.1 YkgJ family cysteine cluster protein [Deltaproteobacteria bacterium]
MNADADDKRQGSPPPATAPEETPDSTCRRCGTCCQKGGPSFHLADRALIESGEIPSKYLYTIREGEMAYDNVRQCLEPVDSDIIKIKGKGNSWTCLFFDEAQAACTIYENRPIECRALKCWDTAELEAMYAQKRLKREDLLAGIEGLWDLIKDHQQRCNYAKVLALLKGLDSDNRGSARRKLAELIQFDNEIRKLVVSRAGLDADILDFLFGRPLNQTLKNFGLRVKGKGKKIFFSSAETRETKKRPF